MHVGPREPRQLCLVTDPPPADPVAIEHHLVQRLVGHGGRRVELALGFLDDDLELAGQLVGVDDGMAERVRLDVEGRGKAGGGKDGEVRGVS